MNGGVAVEGASVAVTIRIKSPAPSACTIFEETHTLNMTSSGGVFSVVIGSGTRTSNDKGLSIAQIFQNRATALTGLTCANGTTYTPAATDSRDIYLSYDDGVNNVAFATPYSVQSVPYAVETDSLSGKSATDFLQATTDSTQTKLNTIMVPTTYAELIALAGGTSTQYATASGASFSSNVTLNSHRITGLANPTSATDAATKQYSDGYVGGKAADTATLTGLVVGDAGKLLTWSGTQWTASAPTGDSTKLPLSGGTMTGAITMGSNNLNSVGFVTQSAGKYLQFGRLDDTAESALVATPLTSTYAGSTWFNTSSSQLKYWDGSAVQSLSPSFTTQTANQVYAGPSSGGAAAPAFRSLVEADVPSLTASGKVANSATTATSSNTNSAIVARDGSGGFSAGAVSVGSLASSGAITATTVTGTALTGTSVVYKDSGTNTVTVSAPTSVTSSYSLKWPLSTGASDNGKVLSTDASGQLSWISAGGGGGGSVTGVTATSPLASSCGTAPNITIAKATTSVDGYLAATDFTTFSNKQSSSLTDSSIWVGNGSGVATGVAVSGDVSLANTGAMTVNGVKGKSVSATPTTAGQVLRYDGTSWTPNYISMQDLRSTVTGAQSVQSCGAGQTLTYTSVSDNLACTTIAISDSQITYSSQAANKFLASPSGSTGAPVYRAIASADLPAAPYDSTYLKNGGNSFGASASLGTTDAFDLTFKTNNSPKMTITSGGSVGIGTTSPAAGLDLVGTLKVSSSSSLAGSVAISDSTASSGSGTGALVVAGGVGVAGTLNVGTNARVYGALITGNTGTPGVIRGYDDTQRVAIAGGNPSTSGANILLYGGTHASAAGVTTINNGTSELVRVSAAGNVGIGTTSPGALLDVAGAGRFSNYSRTSVQGAILLNTSIAAGSSAYLDLQSGAANSVAQVSGGRETGTGTTGYLSLATRNGASPDEIVRVTSGGNVGIGTTSPATRLQVAGTLVVGDGGETCGATYAGGVRYNSGNIQFCNGTTWSTLGTAGAGITALTGDVTASGTGSVAATVAQVNGVAYPASPPTNTVPVVTSSGVVTYGSVPIAAGGTGQTSKAAAFNALSPMTTLGDIVYGGASGTGTALTGNTTTTKKFLSQTGNGSTSAAPAWSAFSSSDLPTFTNYSAMVSNGSGTLTALPGTTSGTMLQYSAVGPIWTTATFPTSTTANQLLYSSATNVVGGLTSANNGVLTTSGSGVPQWLAAGTDGYVLTMASGAPTWQAASGGGGGTMGGTGTAGYMPYFSGSTTLANSPLYVSGSNVGIGTTSPTTALSVAGTIQSSVGGFSSTQSGTGTVELTAGTAPSAPAAGVGDIYINSSGMLQCQYGASQTDCIPSYTASMGTLSSDVTFTNASWNDGPSVTLSAGTYMVMGTVTIRTDAASTAKTIACKLWDKTTSSASSELYFPSLASTRSGSISLSAIVSPSTTKTYYISCINSTAATQTIAMSGTYSGSAASTLSAVRTK